MTQRLILIRGLPGSGKSTLAKALTKDNMLWLETDFFFIDEKGDYIFNKTLLNVAHAWCKKQTLVSLLSGYSVVVSNTFVKLWELEPYLNMAKDLKIKPFIIETKGKFQSIHNVPQETIERMRQNWEILP